MGFEGAAASHLGGSLLLLGLGTLLLGPGCLAQGFWYHSERDFSDPYEVLIPRQLGPRRGDPEVAGRISYLLQVEGKKQIVHLRLKKFLVSKRLRVSSFTKQGALVEDEPYIPSDCSYGGYLEGSPDSQATLNTCFGGLRGLLSFKGRLYQIEPLKFSSRFEHILYRLKEEESNLSCQVRAPLLSQGQDLEISAKLSWSYLHLSFVETYFVISKGRYELLNSNETACIDEAYTLAGWADTVYQALNCRIHLVGISVWTQEDKVSTLSETQYINFGLMNLKGQLESHLSIDWLHLIINRDIKPSATLGSICSVASTSLSGLARGDLTGGIKVLHVLGHLLGITHDAASDCICAGPDTCLMNETPGLGGFSNCSYALFYSRLTRFPKCLLNIPYTPVLDESHVLCGDKVVQHGEQCDCGSPKECLKDKCCQPTCQLKPTATCAFGLCCYQCRFKSAGQLCRPKKGECDLEEFCNGTSSECPPDLYIQNGTRCALYGLCYGGKCTSPDQQCRDIFGPMARSAPQVCFDTVNSIGDRFGNCGFDRVKDNVYKQCSRFNSRCGKLQCINIQLLPLMPEHYTIISTHIARNNVTCWGIEYHFPMEALNMPNFGDVRDGTPCTDRHFCRERVCLSKRLLETSCTPEKCHKRGVCNSRHNCHCHYGWAPPLCEKEGFGGSIDSGPPPEPEKKPKKKGAQLSYFNIRLIALIFTAGVSVTSKIFLLIRHI